MENGRCVLESYDQPIVLFLRGCFICDCNSIEDLFDERIIDAAMTENELYSMSTRVVYDSIPTTFSSIESWKKKTNLKCWSCDCTFHSVPIFIPTSVDRPGVPGAPHGRMDVLGNFCTWNCAAGWIDLHFSRGVKWERLELLKLLYKIFNGREISDIMKAPSKTCMEQYGGGKTRGEYTKDLSLLDDTYNTSMRNNDIDNILCT